MKQLIGRVVCAGMALVMAGCASTREPEKTINVAIGPDGELVFLVDEDADPEEAAMIAVLNQFAAESNKTGALEEEAETAEALSEDEIWREIDGGHLLHIQSGAICAAAIADVGRERTVVFAPDGSDVGCNYSIGGGGNYVTLYVFTRPHGVADEWEVAHTELTARQPAAREQAFSKASTHFASTTLAFEGADGTPVRSSLLLSEAGGWLLKMRITCLERDCARVEGLASLGLIGQIDRLRTAAPAPDVTLPAPT